ncbi:ABC transporter [Burkholderia ubonensis]|uniref:ABC transporter ATP-binding protein n=1 Tax=Burkholderia TaxID=32008 RepID=UPI0005AC15F7|nr:MULTISPECIES: ABC transporter ATP-binding protein [Burkholderia]KIP18952.1 ABC transporter family protein [Burkholderia sp. MSHR3999]KVC93183.1 ABC transporter [Burkholderia ubonensis]KVC94998.1 ABC transporter [Burkholderia ubonensis]KVD03064.1 ABC transporter [Burkholderia ubonensis]KVD19894.1 ABC transporter [Burkholderia ubonensis]
MDKLPHALRIDGLDVAYGARTILARLSLRPVPPGSAVALLGPNGVGKSTLLRALARLVAARGAATLDRHDLLRGARRDHMRRVGYLPQTLPQPTSLLVYEAVRGALRATCGGLSADGQDARLERVFAQLNLHALATTPLDRLSGGQRQMVGLAQVLVRDTPLLLLDEPTSALDLRWQLLALEAMRDAVTRRGAIALVAMHDLNLAARFCDRLVLLGHEGVVADGGVADVLTPANLRRAYRVDARVERTVSGDYVTLAERATSSDAHAEVF